MAALTPISTRPENLTQIVYDAIREAIISRRLTPGSRVTEAGMAAQLDVSKTPVREALLKLEYVGLIESDGRRGGRIVAPSRRTICWAYEVRAGLEVQVARLLADSQHEHGRLDAASVAAEDCWAAAERQDAEEFRNNDRRFHFALAGATENPVLIRYVRDAYDLTWTLRRRDVPLAGDSLVCAQQHQQVLKAIEAGDVEFAAARMREHVEKVQGMVLAAFEAG